MNKVKRWRKTSRWFGRVETREISIKLVNYTVAFNSKRLGSQLMQEFFFWWLIFVQRSSRAKEKEKARQMWHSRDKLLLRRHLPARERPYWSTKPCAFGDRNRFILYSTVCTWREKLKARRKAWTSMSCPRTRAEF